MDMKRRFLYGFMVTMGIIESRKNEIGICNNIDNNSNTPLLYVEWLSVRGRHFLPMDIYVCFHRVSIVRSLLQAYFV